MKFQIADLYPYEDSGIAAVIERQYRKLQRQKGEPIEVLIIDGDILVVDGNNTAFAAKLLGKREIEGKQISRQDIRPYRDALETAKSKGQRGYVNWPVDNEYGERAKRYGR